MRFMSHSLAEFAAFSMSSVRKMTHDKIQTEKVQMTSFKRSYRSRTNEGEKVSDYVRARVFAEMRHWEQHFLCLNRYSF